MKLNTQYSRLTTPYHSLRSGTGQVLACSILNLRLNRPGQALARPILNKSLNRPGQALARPILNKSLNRPGQANKGVIVIAALWIVAILSVFAIAAARQSAISLKIISYNIDKQKAYFIARAGISRALSEKALEYKKGRSETIDALSEKWANSEELFKNHKFGDGAYTLVYEALRENSDEETNPKLYGLMDEQSKININSAPLETLSNLVVLSDIPREAADETAQAIIDWRDAEKDEEEFYEYKCKNMPFDTIYELTAVKGISQELLENLSSHITVYGDGKVNINTAGEKALNALFEPEFPRLAAKIVKYRLGLDEEAGTKDDKWFSIGPYVIERGEEGLVEIKNLQDPEWYANIYGITTEEYNRIRQLVAGKDIQLCTSSSALRAVAVGEVKKVKVRIEAVYIFGQKDKAPKIKFWYQDI